MTWHTCNKIVVSFEAFAWNPSMGVQNEQESGISCGQGIGQSWPAEYLIGSIFIDVLTTEVSGDMAIITSAKQMEGTMSNEK